MPEVTTSPLAFEVELTNDPAENAFRLRNAIKHTIEQFNIIERRVTTKHERTEQELAFRVEVQDKTIAAMRAELAAMSNRVAQIDGLLRDLEEMGRAQSAESATSPLP